MQVVELQRHGNLLQESGVVRSKRTTLNLSSIEPGLIDSEKRLGLAFYRGFRTDLRQVLIPQLLRSLRQHGELPLASCFSAPGRKHFVVTHSIVTQWNLQSLNC